MKFIFDLDGTLTRRETLPLMARICGLEGILDELTENTIKGNIPFVESFIRRVGILGPNSAKAFRNALLTVPLFSEISAFIKHNTDHCIVATGNLDAWIKPLCETFGCAYYTSKADVHDDKIVKLRSILKKEDIVKQLQSEGETVVYIGDGNNDAEAMRIADISIASGLVHYPARSVMEAADFAVFSESALVRLLQQLHCPRQTEENFSLILACAGVGSRLGLTSTKALIELNGRPFIEWHLRNFAHVADIRVVVGFEADSVIATAKAINDGIVFVLNHDYFSTGTGHSLFLASRYANEYIVSWDGDLVVHHSDIERCLSFPGEYLGISKARSSDAVYVDLTEDGKRVRGFSRECASEHEWSGPAKLRRERIQNVKGDVFAGLIEALPLPAMFVNAFDVDTSDDYMFAINNFTEFYGKR